LSHRAGRRFWREFADLPPEIQKLARENYDLLKSAPKHPSLHFKRVGRFWSVRVGASHRVLGIDSPTGIVWFWIGPHEEYLRLIKRS
jgi:hypothetical protein